MSSKALKQRAGNFLDWNLHGEIGAHRYPHHANYSTSEPFLTLPTRRVSGDSETPNSPGPLRIGPGPKGLPLPTGTQRALFASDGYDSYATHTAGPDLTNTKHPVIFFLPAPREAGDVNDLLSGLFVLSGARGWPLAGGVWRCGGPPPDAVSEQVLDR